MLVCKLLLRRPSCSMEQLTSRSSHAIFPRLRSGASAMNEFSLDIQKIKDRARAHMQKGAVTESYKSDRALVVKVLNEVLATELVCTLRYRRHYYTAAGIDSQAVKEEFL